MISPERRKELLSRRWLKLSEFHELAPEMPIRTIKHWAKSGRLPAKRRSGHFWWVDMWALKSMEHSEDGGTVSAYGDVVELDYEGDD